jgi:hypothetical protein
MEEAAARLRLAFGQLLLEGEVELVDRKEQVLQEMLVEVATKETKERQLVPLAQQALLEFQAQQLHLAWQEMVEVDLEADLLLLMQE